MLDEANLNAAAGGFNVQTCSVSSMFSRKGILIDN